MTIFMEKFVEFTKKHNFLDLLIIFLVVTFLFFLSYGKLGSYLVDVGREAYLPWQMNNGEILYKDLFNVYGPLGYQINAVLFKIFGTNLNTLYFAGYCSSVIIAFFVYYITMFFLERKSALAVSFVIVAVSVFSNGLFNFIFPYSYNAVYALVGLLISLYTILLYLRDNNKLFLSLAFLFAGFSFANKIEYLPYFCFLFICLPFLLRNNGAWCKSWQEYCLPIGNFFVFPLFSFSILLFQGASINDFLNAAILIKNVVKAPATEYFYHTYALYAHNVHIGVTLKIFSKILKYVIPFGLCLYCLNYLRVRFIQNNRFKAIFNIALAIFLVWVTKTWYFIVQNKSFSLFCWVGLFLAFVLFGFLFFYGANFIRKKKMFEISLFDVSYLFFLVSSILVSFKGFTQVVLECYGTFSICVMFISLVVFFVHYLPMFGKIFNKLALENTVRNICVIIALMFLAFDFNVFFSKVDYPVKTNNGLIFVTEAQKSQKKLVNFIKNNTKENAVLVSVPEGAIINFLTQRKGHSLYYYLIPGNIQAFGEDKILNDFKNNPPDYFLVNNLPYTFYNVFGFADFAPKLFTFIEKQYTPIYYIDDGLFFVLYQKSPVLE